MTTKRRTSWTCLLLIAIALCLLIVPPRERLRGSTSPSAGFEYVWADGTAVDPPYRHYGVNVELLAVMEATLLFAAFLMQRRREA